MRLFVLAMGIATWVGVAHAKGEKEAVLGLLDHRSAQSYQVTRRTRTERLPQRVKDILQLTRRAFPGHAGNWTISLDERGAFRAAATVPVGFMSHVLMVTGRHGGATVKSESTLDLRKGPRAPSGLERVTVHYREAVK